MVLLRYLLADASDKIVLLKAAEKKGGRKSIKAAFAGTLRCMDHPETVAVPATILFAEDHMTKEFFERIEILACDVKPFQAGISIECLETSFILQIGMDVRIIIVAANLMSFLSQHP
jgi:hypothetical protein